MFLKYLEIHGFKSFPDRTKITFDRGFTAIVGPNGSGKSNISDAVRWVLGEQSTKALRGGKMEDVIFGGTQLRKAMGYAQVSLGLDNSDGRLPGLGEEVDIGRRYYRSGDSEYLINGNTVRLRDVRETFMDTGLSRDGYSIIEQGRVAEIVSSKSTERREIFEEASGIAKYRFRKNEAQRRLEAAADNLERLRDILDELGARIEPLKQQSETAQRFLELSSEKKSQDITLFCDTIERSRRGAREQEEKVEIARRDYNDIENELAELDRREEGRFRRTGELAAAIEGLNAEIQQTTEQTSLIESAAAVLDTDIRYGERQMEDLASERDRNTESSGGLGGEIEQNRQNIADQRAALAELDETIERVTRELNELAYEGEQSDQKRADIARRLSALSSEATDLRLQIASCDSALSGSEGRLAALREQLPKMRENAEVFGKNADEMRAALEELEQEKQSCENQKGGFAQKLELRSRRLEELKDTYEKASFEVEELAHRISALEDMEKSMDGFAPSVKRVVEAARERSLRGIVGPVSSLITIRSGCEIAVETALGAAMQNIVVTDERAARDAIAFLKDNRAGRATFLPMDTVRPSRFDGGEGMKEPGVIGLASELVKYDSRFANIISSLLGRIVIVEDLNCASRLARAQGYHYRIVTSDGQVVNAGGSYTGGYMSRSAGLFSRRGEIERLGEKKAALEKTLAERRAAHDQCKTEVVELSAQITVLDSELINISGDMIRAESELRRSESELSSAQRALTDATAEAEAIERERGEKAALGDSAKKRLEELTAEIDYFESGEQDESSVTERFNRRRNELTEQLSELKVSRMERQKDIERLEGLSDQLDERVEQALSRVGDIEQSIESIRKLNEERRAEIEKRRAEIAELRAAAERCRESIAVASAERNELEKSSGESRESYNSLTRRREEIARELERLGERRETLKKEFDAAVSKLWEEYELTAAEAAPLCVPYENITALRQSVASLSAKIRALGVVNLAAIEEYKEVSERYGFLSAQVEDVEKSKLELERLIDGLMSEMKTIFTRQFSQINRNFKQVFAEMFGGGTAALSLTDPNDVLESGIEIDVQPPGKVIKNLASLSGGEQSLVAIAIYFAILAVNPAPFCVLDEIDSALDDVNVGRFAQYLRRIMADTQFITITHRRGTMEQADALYGVTMQEEGVSKMLKLTRDEAVLVSSK